MDTLGEVLNQYWGYDSFRPLQEEAMQSVLAGEDSLVVMPTGGGKSLCYQAPAIAMPGMAIVVSPLISLMKDQVDFLQGCGVSAACINSSLTPAEKRDIDADLQAGALKLLYVAPERLTMDSFLNYLSRFEISFFAIDEAHCISHWGHDFRPHYRELQVLNERFEGTPIHAYTATATEPVREDICNQLGIAAAQTYIGDFDRPNLVYSVETQTDRVQQVLDKVERHTGEAGIVYCHSRKKVEDMAERLVDAGHAALPYHAGMEDYDRKRNQEAFARDEANIIVATVAFGMGIDKSNVRFVIHSGMPKSLEHYQQESGRAGRDGLEASCYLIHSKADHGFWRRLLVDLEGEAYTAAIGKLEDMSAYATQAHCRHKTLVQYFGQQFLKKKCEACDACLGTVECLDDSLEISQRIVEGAHGLGEVAGPAYTTLVLSGSQDDRVMSKGHNAMPFWGALAEFSKNDIRDWIEQLVGQGYLRKEGEYSILALTPLAQRVLAGHETPTLLKPAPPKTKKRRKPPAKTWEGVDMELVEALRAKRLDLAKDRGVPAYQIFSDATLRDMAGKQPRSIGDLLDVQGIGEKKAHDFGDTFIGIIANHLDAGGDAAQEEAPEYGTARPTSKRQETRQYAFKLYEDGMTPRDVSARTGASSTKALGLLEDYLAEHSVIDVSPWIPDATYRSVVQAVSTVGGGRVRAVYDFLDGQVDSDSIKIALVALRNAGLTGGGEGG